MNYIIDSSVIVKWFSSYNEKHRDKSLYLLNLYKENKINIFIPELVILEISNALRFNKNLEEKEVKEILKYLYSLELTIIYLNEEFIINAINIAYEDNITVYDSIFIEISNKLKIPLISANPKHFKSLKRRNIIMLEDF